MEALRQQGSLTLHTFITSTEFNLGEGKGMSQMETTVHVGIRHTGHVFGIHLVKIFRVGVFLNSGSVDFKCLFAIPEATRLVFKGTEGITLSCLISNIEFSHASIIECIYISTLGASAAMFNSIDKTKKKKCKEEKKLLCYST